MIMYARITSIIVHLIGLSMLGVGFTAQAQDIQSGLPAGSAFRDCADCPQMVIIPAGDFLMGSPPDEAMREKDEGPQHRVTIARSFAVGVYEITFAEWDACTADGGCNGHHPFDYGRGRGSHPVVDVSWQDAQAYVKWLSRKTRQHYRLLTEAEWEYAARAGSSTEYYWGTRVGQNHANCQHCGSAWEGKQPAPVGSFVPNAFGLFDMLGNVWEWVADRYHASYHRAPRNGRVWTGGEDMRVVRGGSWMNEADESRAARRDASAADGRGENSGFRVARELR